MPFSGNVIQNQNKSRMRSMACSEYSCKEAKLKFLISWGMWNKWRISMFIDYKTDHRRDSPPPLLVGQLTTQNKIFETTHRRVACLSLCSDWVRICWINTAHQFKIGVGMSGAHSKRQFRLHTFSRSIGLSESWLQSSLHPLRRAFVIND